MVLRSALVKRVTVLAAVCLTLISLFQYYKYNMQLKYKPSQDFLDRLTEARKADSESTRRKVAAKLTDNSVKEFEPPAPLPKGQDENSKQLPNDISLSVDKKQEAASQQKPALAAPAVPQQSFNNRIDIQSKRKGELLTKNTVLKKSVKATVLPKINNLKGESIEEDAAVGGKRSLGEERADDQYDSVTAHIKTLHSLDVKSGKCVFGRNKAREQEWIENDKKTSRKTPYETRQKADHIKEMMIHGWSNYRKYAWGANEFAPLVQRPHGGPFPGTKMGLTIVDSLDTLWIMGMFDEVEVGKQWLVQNLSTAINVNVEVSVFEFNIRYVGGLLAMFALTNECEYKQLAMLCADKLVPAFNTTYGIPTPHVNLKYGRFAGDFDQTGGTAVLSEIGTLHLEFVYLSHITGKPMYRQLVEHVRDKILKANVDGLYGNNFYVANAEFSKYSLVVSMGGMGDSFYEYLFKSFLQTGGKDTKAKDEFFAAMQAIHKAGILKTSNSGLKYYGVLNGYGGKVVYDKMEHLACFIGGVLGLAAEYSSNKTETLQLAEDIANTCHESYIRTETKIGPESFTFNTGQDAQARGREGDPSYHLRPETVETWFFLQRITKASKYKDWAWNFAQALDTYCKVPHGYVGLVDVNLKRVDNKDQPLQEDVQQSFFLAETLKYLYLIYKDDGLLPIKEWVFNTEAHPLPVFHPASP